MLQDIPTTIGTSLRQFRMIHPALGVTATDERFLSTW
jgi:hypothetical protein